MTISFKFYHDAALTQEITSGNPLPATHGVGATDPVDKTIYLGSTVAGNKLQDGGAPGTAPIVVSIVDSDTGTGAPASEFQLALSSGGLAAAVAGASLTLSATLTSGVANAVPIYTRRTSSVGVAGAHSDITLATGAVVETPV